MEVEILKYDILIIGAGPAGCAAALRLRDTGLRVAIVDKSTFPRDKICGDAIPWEAVSVLKKLNPAYLEAFREMPRKVLISHAKFFAFEHEPFEIDWVNEGYCCSRMTFDHELFKLVESHANITIYQGVKLSAIEATSEGVVALSSQYEFHAGMVIGCDGAQSIVAKLLADRKMNHRHHSAAVRAYFEGVEGVEPHTNEFYIHQKHMPGYFWLFPVEGNRVNIGFGMRSDFISGKKVNLRKSFYQFIEDYPVLRDRMKNATQIGKLEGFSLPMGSKFVKMAGARFFLAGDAASLIDPITGSGIGNAMISGSLAAEKAIRCFSENDFSEKMAREYEQELYESMSKDMIRKGVLQQISSKYPWMINISLLFAKNKWVRGMVNKIL